MAFSTLAIIIVLLVLVFVALKQRTPRNLPPGPPRLPLIGNLNQVPSDPTRDVFHKWHKEYGPIVSLSLGTQTLISLGNAAVAQELFGKRGRIYSARPRMVMTTENLTHEMHTALLSYGPHWKAHNRIHNAIVSMSKAQCFQELIEAEVKLTLHQILKTNNFDRAFVRFSSSTISSLAYGKRLKGDEVELKEMLAVMDDILTALTGTWLVDMLPFVNHLLKLINPWKMAGDKSYRRVMQNFTKHAHGGDNIEGLSADEVKFLIGVLPESGIDFMSTVFRYCILACIINKDKVQKAQKELDEVVGKTRLPNLDDMASMPYAQAFVKEILRWRSITVAAVPHRNTEDDVFMGYNIPKNSTILLNYWATNLDVNTYGQDAADFRPERWLEDLSLPLMSFGYGRRTCSGQHLARAMLDELIPSLLWAFDIDPGYENGVQAKPDSFSLVEKKAFIRPPPFPAIFKPRDAERKRLVEQEFQKETNLDEILCRLEDRVSGASEREVENLPAKLPVV